MGKQKGSETKAEARRSEDDEKVMTAADLKGRWPHKRLFLSLSLSLEIRLIFFYSFFFSSSDGCGVFQEWLLRLRLREVHVANSADALGRCTHRTDTATAEEIF